MSIQAVSPGILPDRSRPPSTQHVPSGLPSITLRHGQVLWLLTKLGFADNVNKHTFHVYIKSLRKLGVPFGRRKFRSERGNKLARYSYYEIMELALILSLRVYQVIPDSVLKEIARHRALLSKFYHKAYSQRRRARGRPITIAASADRPIEMRGLFLDLNMKFSGGQLAHFGPPKLLSPERALAVLIESTAPSRRFLPLNLSMLSEQIIALMVLAPNVNSGRAPRHYQTKRKHAAFE